MAKPSQRGFFFFFFTIHLKMEPPTDVIFNTKCKGNTKKVKILEIKPNSFFFFFGETNTHKREGNEF